MGGRRWSRRIAVAAGAAVAVAAGAPAVAGAASGSGPLRPADALHVVAPKGKPAYLATRDGRRVFLRGANVAGLIDYAGARPVTPVTSADGVQLRALGLNVVRLAVSWSAIEPSPGVIDQAYLAKIRRAATDFSRRGAYVLLSMHFDRYAANLGQLGQESDGAPAWAVDAQGASCDPVASLLGGHQYYVSPCATAAANQFWSNATVAGRPLQESYGDAVLAVAGVGRRLGPAFAGIDLYNEPTSPGPDATVAAWINGQLWPMYRRLLVRLRGSGYHGPVWLTPLTPVPAPGASTPPATRFGGDRQLVLAYHPYIDVFQSSPDAGTAGRISKAYRAMNQDGRTQRAVPMVTEFPGATDGPWDAYRRVQLQAQDRNLIGGIVWIWKQPTSLSYGWSVLQPNGRLRPRERNALDLGRPRLVASAPGVVKTTASAHGLTVRTTGRAGIVQLWTGASIASSARTGVAPVVTIDRRAAKGRSRPRAITMTSGRGGARFGGRLVRLWVPAGRHTLRLGL